ncbi:C40 family peptidase [Flammeovirgaceae bacterium SG7u.111]|nr:C40 family peptidase [Flammeovirgaceae bacterium SG7u.132]WPO38563.1 C40 family peptidase [Flammeovirgaceae bacterium SG7u.111]
MKTRTTLATLICLFLLWGCSEEIPKSELIKPIIKNIQENYAPDKRVALFNVDIVVNGENIIFVGETDNPEAKKALLDKARGSGFFVQDDIELLPNQSVKDEECGVVSVSVANLRSDPKHSAELATQATLGTPLKVLKKNGSWYLVQTPDKYISWVDQGGIATMSRAKYKQWLGLRKVVYTRPLGFVYESNDKTSPTVSDLVGGDILTYLEDDGKFFKVLFPDKRIGYVSMEEAQSLNTWLENIAISEESLVATSKLFMGVPYLWGGTSFKGVDCSGFTKSIYFMNGMVIPRDASQQVFEGKEIETTHDFNDLRPGDLLFFGRQATESTKEKVVHVGMWIGNDEFIHSSGQVRVSSMNPKASNYDAYEKGRFLRAKRILSHQNENLLSLKSTNIFQQTSAKK